MNDEKYDLAEKIIGNSKLWFEDKHLLLSVVARAQKLEKDVIKCEKSLKENAPRIPTKPGVNGNELTS